MKSQSKLHEVLRNCRNIYKETSDITKYKWEVSRKHWRVICNLENIYLKGTGSYWHEVEAIKNSAQL